MPEDLLLTPERCHALLTPFARAFLDYAAQLDAPVEVVDTARVVCFLLEVRAHIAAGKPHQWAAYVAALPDRTNSAAYWSKAEVVTHAVPCLQAETLMVTLAPQVKLMSGTLVERQLFCTTTSGNISMLRWRP